MSDIVVDSQTVLSLLYLFTCGMSITYRLVIIIRLHVHNLSSIMKQIFKNSNVPCFNILLFLDMIGFLNATHIIDVSICVTYSALTLVF